MKLEKKSNTGRVMMILVVLVTGILLPAIVWLSDLLRGLPIPSWSR